MTMKNRDVITLGWITENNDAQSANVNESKTRDPSDSYITEECNTTKTTRPLPRTPAKISQTALQTPCCSTALSDCAEKVFLFFQSTTGKKRALNIKFPRSVWCQDGERHIFTFALTERFLNELSYLSSTTGRIQAGKVLPTGKVSEGCVSAVIHANSSYNNFKWIS